MKLATVLWGESECTLTYKEAPFQPYLEGYFTIAQGESGREDATHPKFSHTSPQVLGGVLLRLLLPYKTKF